VLRAEEGCYNMQRSISGKVARGRKMSNRVSINSRNLTPHTSIS
jgi:hypothetical protein